jgi:hypothetical protein
MDDRVIITEAAFLRIFMAWEAFLEKSFWHYMMGQPSLSGTVIHRFASPRDEDHANRLLIGIGRFVDWSTPDVVSKLAGLFLDKGDPFESVLSAIHSDLLDLKTVRNSAAHLTSSTSVQLDALASRRLGRSCSGTSVYDFILAPDPSSAKGATILQSYMDLLDAACHRIAYA